MSSQPPSTIFRDAADELANEFARRQFPADILDRDAAQYVTTEVASNWIAMELGIRSSQEIVSDLVYKLTDTEATNLLRCLLQQDGIPALVHLSREMHQQCAHDLAYEAQQKLERMERVDADLDPLWDDPVRSDLRALATVTNSALRLVWP